MGFFTKNSSGHRPMTDTQRFLSPNGNDDGGVGSASSTGKSKSGKKKKVLRIVGSKSRSMMAHHRIIQLKESSSSTADDDEVSLPNNNRSSRNNGNHQRHSPRKPKAPANGNTKEHVVDDSHATKSASTKWKSSSSISKSKSPMKSKFWKLQDDALVDDNSVSEYVPPPGNHIFLPSEQEQLVQQLQKKTAATTLPSNNGSKALAKTAGTVALKKKQHATFQRLDSMDDNASSFSAASASVANNGTVVPSFHASSNNSVASSSALSSSSHYNHYGSSTLSSSKKELPSKNAAMVKQPFSNSSSSSSSSPTKRSKTTSTSAKKKSTAATKKYPSKLQPVGSSDGSDKSNMSWGTTYGGYQPPPTLFGFESSTTTAAAAPTTNDNNPAKNDTTDGGGSESDESWFDVRSERSKVVTRGVYGGNSSSTTNQQNGSGTRGGGAAAMMQRSDSGLYSQASTHASESSFSTAGAAPDQDFRQIMFDDQKVARVTKSDAGSSDFSDFVKAASNLTQNLSKAKNKSNAAAAVAAATHSQRRATATVQRDHDSVSSKNMNVPWPEPAVAALAAAKTQPSDDDFKSQWNQQPVAGFGKAATSEAATTFNNFDDCGFSVSSNQSSQKSRRDFQAAMQSKSSSRGGVRIGSGNGHPGASQSQKSVTSRNYSSAASASVSESLAYSTVSESNATFQSAASRRPFSIPETTTLTKEPATTLDPFQQAADFSVANFCSDEADPFHIGEIPATSSDSTWNVDANPFPDLKPTAVESTTKIEQQMAKPVEFTSQHPKQQHHLPHEQDERQPHKVQPVVHAASSMDDGLLMAAIRTSAFMSTSSALPPAHDAVQPSSSDSVLEYARRHPKTANDYEKPTGPKAVPANAILGSMLFRQTESIHGSTSNEDEDEQEQSKKSSKRKESSHATPTDNVVGGGGSRKARESRGNDDDGDDEDDPRSCKVPRSVHMMEKNDDDGAHSIVSSVTEEASSFYNKSFGHNNSNSAHWNRQAQNVLNHYNVKRTLQSRDANTYGGGGAVVHKIQQQQQSYPSRGLVNGNSGIMGGSGSIQQSMYDSRQQP